MHEKDIIATFKKHIGEVDLGEIDLGGADFTASTKNLKEAFKIPLCKNLKITHFGEDIKSVNELTGALQTLQIVFRKITDLAQSIGQDPIQDALLECQIKDKIAECRFLGNALFDVTLSAKIGQKQLQLENPSPLPLLQNGNPSLLIDYIQDKNTEITQTLTALSQAIASQSPFSSAQPNADIPNLEHFDKDMLFKKLR
ncbi:flagellar FLiS export co-chaperone [Helicobacter fennelliae]|uniref:Uncharacterized protein n=2 Tax=Helicobacter fennelliae TaxID=215 RepID=T1CSD0_9HELI|nr:flagellar FLiS export co-chaperone [Helicobacter fennelliae]GAD19704.1 conserved hypothetical protein [Helicobacter fennelliae MRY12-0050]SQB99622.1 Uncharacterised protein [Helicobacter fennelliae]STP07254.1 Uncharacterised protein [Helicobacter fennelliae]STQ85162.1 Uncharacterised protein [Helicobacter fennelliae]